MEFVFEYRWAVHDLHFHHTEFIPVRHTFVKKKNPPKTDLMCEWETLAAETFAKVMQEIWRFQLSSEEPTELLQSWKRLHLDWMVIDNYSQALQRPFRCDPQDGLRTSAEQPSMPVWPAGFKVLQKVAAASNDLVSTLSPIKQPQWK